MRVLVLALLISQAFSISLFSQSFLRISGQVLDDKTNQGVPFAYVTLKGIALGTVTDGSGAFSIRIPGDHKNGYLVFSYVGYESETRKVSEIGEEVEIRLKEDIRILEEVVVVPRKEMTAKSLLRKVIARIPENYGEEPTQIDGYYRETLQENGAYFKYADAAVSYYYAPYSNKKYKWKDYAHPFTMDNGTLSAFNFYAGARLHRVHFEHRTLKEDQVKIIDSRSSADLSESFMHANIEGGPLGILGRDRMKFQEAFTGRKKFKMFDYELGEAQDENGDWVYVLRFRTKITRERLEKFKRHSNKQWRIANNNKLLEGKMYIDRNDLAVLNYEVSVPNELKDFFCSYTDMAIKHFDYKVSVSYKKKGDRYYIDHVRHEDEFIYRDSVNKITTPYAAIAELQVTDTRKNGIVKFAAHEVFNNYNVNQLYDYPLEYHKEFWEEYASHHPQFYIPEEIRQDLEFQKTLEQQFHDKHVRNEDLAPPEAIKKPVETRMHGDILVDAYAWLKDTKTARSNQDIMNYVSAENRYAENYFIPLRATQRKLFEELISRVEKNYVSHPTKEDGYEYFVKYSAEDEHPVFKRRKEGSNSEEVILDVNKMAEGKDYYDAGYTDARPDTHVIAFYENTSGNDTWTLKFKDLRSGKLLPDSITSSVGMEWIDDEHLLYLKQEKKTNRVFQIWRHKLGTPQKEDKLLLEEKDRKFALSMRQSLSREFIYITAASSTTSEVRFLRTDAPYQKFRLVQPREQGVLYGISDFKDNFFMHTNSKAINYKVLVSDTSSFTAWKSFIPHRKDVMINGILQFENYYVVREKAEVQNRIRVVERSSGTEHYLKFKEDIYNVNFGYNPESDTDTLQFIYASFITSSERYNYHMGTKEKRLVKKQQVLNTPFLANKIKVERLWATAPDGKKVPVTLIYRKWAKKKTGGRLYLTSYGSYGNGMDVGFDHTVFSYLDREFIYAIAHVRGGDDLGRGWYEDGKMLNKKNTFTDFIAVAEHLVSEGYVEKGNIVAEGGSAGGLLMGAVANMRPDLFKLIILEKPFVDVLNTMLDPALPLTTLEYEEWGTPKIKKYYRYIKSYSPYENVRTQDYPNMLFVTGLNDTRVGYWEPAKMVAKLRDLKTDNNTILLKTDLTSGHGGGSGRYTYFRELAYKMALIMDFYTKDLHKVAETKAD